MMNPVASHLVAKSRLNDLYRGAESRRLQNVIQNVRPNWVQALANQIKEQLITAIARLQKWAKLQRSSVFG